ncbi:UNVERIFIED_ORG: hypothetical protein HNP28_001023 [Comamonas terrigena]
MNSNNSLNEFREKIDSDEGLLAIRKKLTIFCMIFLALNISGATLEEANTLIFKLKFTNHAGIGYLFLLSVIFLTIRYYSYATDYQSLLNRFWRLRMLENYKIFSYDNTHHEVRGLLGNAIQVYGLDEPGIKDPEYVISGFLKRSIAYDSVEKDEWGEAFQTVNYIPLFDFTEKWTLKNYLNLLWIEISYRTEAFFKYRENLDLIYPYIISFTTIFSFIFKDYLIGKIS